MRKIKTYTLEQLNALAVDYLATLDNDIPDERYTTDYGFATIGMDGFLKWLAMRERAARYVQILNPRSERYVKIDRKTGQVVSTKKTPGPYKHVEIKQQ
jgi:hypothetical protein